MSKSVIQICGWHRDLPQKSIINQAVLFEDVTFISGAIFYFGGVS